ncbi:Putative UDP-glucuronosyltransferase ugt-60 [Caenorhabditis elegans]|uniref:Putative UDP-glucuronosyltransferase ugt-60 n=1 Tax=Caenorhabditis elegans TaxID=6239 RepID=UGT60_CAEEL|nr:Putative UDP-glucuronosyltransferase ugt-60 [Caenorhabditis elegans]P34317.2 RecName: Full=Putative UDP-glucuronosyltransferase ugt-60; Short=UDPGT 60; Flags: Precursor [Caenorhabditis elegans]CAA82344.2 Putative UDP-glucuronosyltransferase ugt-60 [Caenorhabditis elegans]|eukprot:NP_001021158.1 Putative UDP-glucuronosyltransferase ugt-60 [Caenorhabditis elegans]
MYLPIFCIFLSVVDSLRILQIVPGFTNSHVLFNYRLAETLRFLGHDVKMWTQMEMAMLDTGNNKLPEGVSEYRIPIHFTDTLKTEGLKVFQSMMFESGDAHDLWWTGQEFKDMRVEACEQMLRHDESVYEDFRKDGFDVAIAHFHDLCPLAIAKKMNVKRVIWITHGTSIYEFSAVQLGLRTIPSTIPHPLSSAGFSQLFLDRVQNTLWHLSLLDFVNLPQNLLVDENLFYREFVGADQDDLWDLAKTTVPSLLINGDRMLDFPRPLPIHIAFSGELGVSKGKKLVMEKWLEDIIEKPSDGLIVFSLGTVSNTTNMPAQMINSFLGAFGKLKTYTILWRMEKSVAGAEKYENLHLVKWLPQKDIMRHPKMKLMIAHGGYNSFLEAAQAGIPAVLMPLFADQKINAKRAQRYGMATVLDKLDLTINNVYGAIKEALKPEYSTNAKKLSAMLSDQVARKPYSALRYSLKLATSPKPSLFTLKSQHLSFLEFHNLDIFSIVLLTAFIVCF